MHFRLLGEHDFLSINHIQISDGNSPAKRSVSTKSLTWNDCLRSVCKSAFDNKGTCGAKTNKTIADAAWVTLQATSTHDAEMKASIAMGEENFKREAPKVAGKWWSDEKNASKKRKGTE
jgi:hypothetical protein